jgi:hypothetical protein
LTAAAWGSNLSHHPHVHGIVPGGGLSMDGKHWVSCKPGFFLPVRVLSRLFRRLFLEKLQQAYQAGKLEFSGDQQKLMDKASFFGWLKPLKKIDWVVYAKRPFAGPESVLAYLSRYTHRVAISNSRLRRFDGQGVTFRWKDYRSEKHLRYKNMTLSADEFIRRFLMHVLPGGFQRLRHYGLLANARRKENLKQARELLIQKEETIKEKRASEETTSTMDDPVEIVQATYICPHCSSPMKVIDVFTGNQQPRAPPLRLKAS